jgi:hypothetical protein
MINWHPFCYFPQMEYNYLWKINLLHSDLCRRCCVDRDMYDGITEKGPET